ncbi:MAG: MATE family efflux transporter [Lawsonibacter sp.]
MLEAAVQPLICSLAVPTIISMLVTSIYNMADTYFVSQINTSASGAVGVVFSIMAAIQAVGFTVGMGSGSIISRLLGQDRGEDANVYASSAVLTALVLGLFLSIVGLFHLEQLIWLLGSTQTIHPYAVDYARYILLGAPVMALSFTLNNLLRWQGRANLSVFGLATGGILNMILDPIFIFVFDMGIGGAGAATLLSQCVSLTILSSFFVFKKSDLRISTSRLSRSPKIYLAILKQGMPSFFRQAVFSFATMSLNFNARLYGDAAVAAMSIVSKVFMVANSVIIGFGQGFQPVVGYNYGAGRLDRVKQALVFSIKVCTVILAVAAVACYVFAPEIITVFRRNDPDVIAIGTKALRFQSLTLPLGAVLVFSNMLFQSLGKSWRATFLAICRQGLFIPFVYLMRWQFGLTGLEATQPVVDLFAFLFATTITLHYFLREFDRQNDLH